ncbi:hypothetical protein F7725_006563, partial [Dissostichus mawsoni]
MEQSAASKVPHSTPLMRCQLSSLMMRDKLRGVDTGGPKRMTEGKTKWKVFLEVVSVLQAISSFLFLGGRKTTFVRNWRAWEHLRDFFPIKSCGFKELFPGLTSNLLVLAGLFRLPLFREYAIKNSLVHLLTNRGKGNAAVIVIGGATESLASAPGVNIVVMRQRKGFVRVALEFGADLVPAYAFGENELFKQVVFSEGSLGRRLQDLFKKIMGFAPCYSLESTWVSCPTGFPSLLLWEVQSQCRSTSKPPRRRWTTFINFTWRPSPRMTEGKTKWKVFLEVVSTLQAISTFLFLGVACTLLMFYLMFTSLWPIPTLYFVWQHGELWLQGAVSWLTSNLLNSLVHLLTNRGKGNAAVILIGGAAEALFSAPGVNTLVMRQRKGFVRVALEFGADLVPAYAFGENELFKQVVFSEGSLGRRLQDLFKKIMGFAPCLFVGEHMGILPYRNPITTVVGSPISVPKHIKATEEEVDHFHKLYMEALSKSGLHPLDVLPHVHLSVADPHAVLRLAGGRKTTFVRNWRVWEHLRDFFPIKNYVVGIHPHGIMCVGAFTCFSTESCGFKELFPGLTSNLVTLAGVFRLPLFREYAMFTVSKKSLTHLLTNRGKGNAVVIVIGGAAESLASAPGVNILVMRQRKGFFVTVILPLMIFHRADLVPVYAFGENELFKQVILSEGSLGRRLQELFKKIIGFAPCLFVGEHMGILPYRNPITTVVGSPISVPKHIEATEEEVDHFHKLYMEALS